LGDYSSGLGIPGYDIDAPVYGSAATHVYRAKRVKDGVRVVIKTAAVGAESAAARGKLHHERELLQDLDVEGVPRLIEAVSHRGMPVLVLADSGLNSLRAHLAQHRLFSPQTFLTVAQKLTAIVGRVHEAGVVHKDINPSNVLFDPTSGEVELIDFDIASLLPRECPELRSPERIEGTLPYISPEQTGRMNRAIDTRTDIYSLGMTFYEMLTGAPAFDGRDAMEMVHRHIAKAPTNLHQVDPNIPEAVAAIVDKCLSKMAEDRYQSTLGLEADLAEVLRRLNEHESLDDFAVGAHDLSPVLHLPQKLYGRAREVAQLHEAFDRVRTGKCEFLFVEGYSGIGKSALINEVHKDLVSERGYFATGKFDQFKRDIPFGAVVTAMGNLCRDLSLEGAEAVAMWRARLVEVVGDNVPVLVDMIPELELLVGSQPPPLPVSPMDARNRFTRAFEQFLRVFDDAGHPVVIFIDDLQWADAGTLQLLESVAKGSTQRVLWLGAYRDNEVSATHPLSLTINAIREADNAPLNTLPVRPLELGDVEELLSDVLHEPRTAVSSLAALMAKQTGANPFFLGQMIENLRQKDLIRLDMQQRRWVWDLAAIERVEVSDNVVDLMIQRIGTLPETTQRKLQVASCVGSRFALGVLAEATSCGSSETRVDLWEAVRGGFLVPLDERYRNAAGLEDADIAGIELRFAHDRVQQSASAMLGDDERAATRLRIGRILLARGDEASSGIFEILGHLYAGRAGIVDASERATIAQLARTAAERARSSTAYETAHHLVCFGMELLPDDSWDVHYALTYALHLERLQCEYLVGDFEAAERYFQLIVSNAHSKPEVSEAYRVRVVLCENLGQYADGLRFGMECLKMLGLELSFEVSPAEIEGLIKELDDALGDRSIASLRDSDEMTDPIAISRAMMLLTLQSTSYFITPTFFQSIIIRGALEHLRHGSTPFASFAYGGLATALGELGDYERSLAFGMLAIDVNDIRYDSAFTRGKTYLQVTQWVRFRHQPLAKNLEQVLDSFRWCVRVGELNFASYAAVHVVLLLLATARSLREVHEQAQIWLAHARSVRNDEMVDSIRSVDFAVRALLGLKPSEAESIDDVEQFGDERFEAFIAKNRSMCMQAYYRHHLSMLRYIEGDFAAARAANDWSDESVWAVHGQLQVEEHAFYQSLIQLATCPEAASPEREECLARVRANRDRLKVLVEHSPTNFQHKVLLIEAEYMRVVGEGDIALAYDEALEVALRNGYVQDAAIAAERAFDWYRSRRQIARARAYLFEAIQHYDTWGAAAKVQRLNAEHRALTTTIGQTNRTHETATLKTTLTRSTNLSLDLLSVTKATQAISSEIQLDRLLERLVAILMESAGAERVSIVFARDKQLQVTAQGSQEGQVEVMTAVPLDEASDVSRAVIRHVARTREAVILDDAANDGAFKADPDVRRRKIRSLLCMPILGQGRLIGLVYLENNLTTGCFELARIEVLKILLGQIAISIEHAMLYQNLEDEVRRRTREVALRQRDIERILDSTADGIIDVELTGNLHSPPSRAASEFFGAAAVGVEVWEYLRPGDAEFGGLFEACFDWLVEDVALFTLHAGQMPRTLERDGKRFKLQYRPVLAEGKLERVLVIATDVTQEHILHEAKQEALERQEVIARLLRDRTGMRAFIEESMVQLEAMRKDTDMDAVKRLIHTLKGNAAAFGFAQLSKRCHEVESELETSGAKGLSSEQHQALTRCFRARRDSIREFLELDRARGVELTTEEHMRFIQAIEAERSHSALYKAASCWAWPRAYDVLSRIEQQVNRMAERQDKSVRVVIDDHGLRLRPGVLDAFISTLGHVARNAVDHGVQNADARRAQGKPPVATISLSTRIEGNRCIFSVEDDGRGIDVEALRASATQRGVPISAGEDGIRDLLFHDGLSTATHVTEVSGRGVGLAAVRAACEQAGGRIDVTWRGNGGTRFAFIFPADVANTADPREPTRPSAAPPPPRSAAA